MTSDERRMYVHGVLAVCDKFKATPDVVTAVCRELGLTYEDLVKVHEDLVKIAAEVKLNNREFDPDSAMKEVR